MGAVDNGTQTIYFAYQHSATSSNFNSKFAKAIQPGVYEGGTLYISAGHDILIGTFSAIFRCTTGEILKVETASQATLTLAQATPYVVASFSWLDQTSNYLDFTAKALSSILNTDVVIGKGVYVGGVLTSFEYLEKTRGMIDQDNNVIANNNIIGKSLYAWGDTSGVLTAEGFGSGVLGITGIQEAGLGAGVGTINVKGAGAKSNNGFIKGYIAGTPIYIPYFEDIG